jgi:hypothetical protein
MSDFNFENIDPTPVVEDHNINVEAHTTPVVEASSAIEDLVIEENIIEEKIQEQTPIDKTAILYAMKDLKVMGLGTLQKGYNTVATSKVNRWLEKASVRLASEQEIKTYHNK